jgi:hypothetical protein
MKIHWIIGAGIIMAPAMNMPFPIRKECPPGACTCKRESLLDDPDGDVRILRLTKEEEKKLIGRIEAITSYEDLRHMEERMRALLGISLSITPGAREVRTARGFSIQIEDRPGLCQKTRQSIPAAVRRCLDNNPDVAYALLNAHDLLGDA